MIKKEEERLAQNRLIRRIDDTLISCEELTKDISRLVKNADITGLAVGIYNENIPVYKKTFGFKRAGKKLSIKPGTVFYGASLSKPVFSALVMILVGEGLISLDTPLHNYLAKSLKTKKQTLKWWTDFTELQKHPYWEKITARMCLSHTSGLPNWRWHEPGNKLHFKFERGTRYSYSGEGYCYLQSIIEKVTKKSLQMLAEEKIFCPLGMKYSAYKWLSKFDEDFCFGHNNRIEVFPVDKGDEERAASTLKTTLDDYSLFICAMLNDNLVKPCLKTEMFAPQISIHSKKQFGLLALEDSNDNDDIRLSYALGWGIFDTPYGYAAFKEGHGDGFAHYTIVFPEKKTGMVALSNCFKSESIFKELFLTSIGDAYSPWQWEDYIPYKS